MVQVMRVLIRAHTRPKTRIRNWFFLGGRVMRCKIFFATPIPHPPDAGLLRLRFALFSSHGLGGGGQM